MVISGEALHFCRSRIADSRFKYLLTKQIHKSHNTWRGNKFQWTLNFHTRKWLENIVCKVVPMRLKSMRCWFGSFPIMITSSNGNIFRVTGPLCGEVTGPGEFPTQRPVTRSFDVFFDLRLNKPLFKQSWGWWFETLPRSLWRHRNVHSSPLWHHIYLCPGTQM